MNQFLSSEELMVIAVYSVLMNSEKVEIKFLCINKNAFKEENFKFKLMYGRVVCPNFDTLP